MMTTRLVYRLLDAEGALLGWTEDLADARGDGTLRAARPIVIEMERGGVPASVSIHWVDVNVETRMTLPATVTAKAGDHIITFTAGQAVLEVGPPAGGLPPVTVRHNVAISVPVGSMHAVGLR